MQRLWDIERLQWVSEDTGNLRRFGKGTRFPVIGPALFDPQINGFAGVDFQDPDLSRDALEHAVHELQNHACSHCLLTLITAPVDALEDQLSRIAEWLETSPRLREAIPGIHLEGPFLSPEPGYIGAHAAEYAIPPDWPTFQRLQKAARNRIAMMTLALEPPGTDGFIRQAARSGVWISIGHSNPSHDRLLSAIQAGARSFTHLGNGCPASLHRHDNIIQRVLAMPRLAVSLIPDGHHVPAPALASLRHALGAARLFYTTDSMSAGGAPSGRYRFAHLELEVGEDRVVRLPGTSQFAGSCLTPLEGLYHSVLFGGNDVGAAWHAWTWLRGELFPTLEAPRIVVALG